MEVGTGNMRKEGSSSINPYEGPFSGTIHMIHDTGYGPGYATGGLEDLKNAASHGILRGIMLVRARSEGNAATRRDVTLKQVIELLPSDMKDGTIAWMKLEGEEQPTTVIINTGLDVPGLQQLTYARLFTSQKRSEEAKAYLNEIRKRSYVDKEILSEPVSIAVLLGRSEEGEDKPSEQSQKEP